MTSSSNKTKNIAIINNVLNYVNLNYSENILVQNNIITGKINNSYGNLFNNNIFLNRGYTSSYDGVFQKCNNNIINNNIFPHANLSAAVNGTGNTFKNNILTKKNLTAGDNPNTSNNYLNVNSEEIFINVTNLGSSDSPSYSDEFNYHLQNPETYIGTDGTQVGIFGGEFPFKDGAIPSNPHFQIEEIENVTNSGTLKVKVKVSAQDN